MQKAALYGIIAVAVVAASVGIAFVAVSSMDNAPAVTMEAASQQVSDPAQRRVIKHQMGETEITGTPERVVVLYSIYAGDVRALGVQPVGIVDRDWINGWLTPIGYPLSEDVVNVGIPNEPNMETILQLEPDLIIGLGGKWGEKHIELYDEFSEIAPTLLFNPDPRPELDELEVAKQNFMAIADALNRHDEGIAWLENMEARYNEASKKIEQAGYKGANVILTTAYLQNDVPEMFIFTEGAFATLLLNKIGLVNEAPDPADTTDTWYRTGMEGLTTFDDPDVHLIVSYNAGQYDTNPLEKSPIYDDLEFVKNGHVHDIGNTRLFGQVLFAEDIANRVVDALTDKQQQSSSDKTRTISHAMGEIEIAGIPERIVMVDDELTENLLTLEVKPVGASLWKTFGTSFEKEKQEIGLSVPSGITNIGDYWAPNLEAITQLEPDVIIASDVWSRAIYDDLNEIAPTLMFATYPSKEGGTATFEEMKSDFMTLADLAGRHEKGQEVLNSLDAKLDNAAEQIESKGLKGHKFLVAEVWVDNGTPTMYLYTRSSVASQTMEKIGLQNALADEESEWGIMTTGLEGLASLDDPNLHFFFGYYNTINEVDYSDTVDIVKNSPVMQSLEFIKKDQAHELGPEFKPRPTPRHMEVMVDRVMAALT